MGLLRFLAVFFVIYLLVRFVRNIVNFTSQRRRPQDIQNHTTAQTGKDKIISKDEGEYVDFEELDNDKNG
jgi:hypothetical protein